MKIHTNKINGGDLRDAANIAGVSFAKNDLHGSRTRDHAWKIQLHGTSSRRPNSGHSGAADGYAATWDEWGIFLAHLFKVDPEIVCQQYNGAAEFRRKTGGRYATLTKEDQHRNHKWEFAGVPREQECKCGAVRRRFS